MISASSIAGKRSAEKGSLAITAMSMTSLRYLAREPELRGQHVGHLALSTP
jgi:hypothetical protein